MPDDIAIEPPQRLPKSERTRSALRAAALQRFRESGYEDTNVADIAADVGVTERTFYRYFPTKDAVLLGGFEQQVEWFQAAFDQRPADEDIVDSVREAATSFTGDPAVVLESANLTDSYLNDAQLTRVTRQLQGVVATIIRRRLGASHGELRAAVAAEMLSGAVFAAFAVWRTGASNDGIESLVTMVDEALELVRPGLPLGDA